MKRYNRTKERKTLRQAIKIAQQDFGIKAEITKKFQKLLPLDTIIESFLPRENEIGIMLPFIEPAALINFVPN